MPLKQIAVYSRKSKFTGKGESIENQIELCKQYILSHYPGFDGKNILIYEDEGFSGGNTRRPNFNRMMCDARSGGLSAVVCYRLDRVSRNIGDFAKLIEELDALSVAFVSIKEQFDTSSPMGRAMMYISSVFSQLERETIAERIRDNMRELAKTGRWLGGISPTGYMSESLQGITVEGKSKKSYKLKIIPEEAETVRLLFNIFLEMKSLSKTETYFIQNDFRTKNGKIYSRFTIKNILANPVYMIADGDAYRYLTESGADLFAEEKDFDCRHGIMAYNRTVQKPGKANQFRPIEEWIVAIGKHKGLIRGREWVCVQSLLGQNGLKAFRRPRNNVALLSGLLYCSCGDYMRPKMNKGKYFYHCAMKEKSRSHLCQMKNAGGNLLDKYLCDEIGSLKEDRFEFIRRLELGIKQPDIFKDEDPNSLIRLQSAFDENGREISSLVSALAKASDTQAEEYIVKRIDGLHIKGESIKCRIAEFGENAAVRNLPEAEFNGLCKMLDSFKCTFTNMSVDEKRAALHTLVEKAVWDGENVHLYLR